MNYINSALAAFLNFKNCSFDPYRIWVRDPWFKLTQHSKNYVEQMKIGYRKDTSEGT